MERSPKEEPDVAPTTPDSETHKDETDENKKPAGFLPKLGLNAPTLVVMVK